MKHVCIVVFFTCLIAFEIFLIFVRSLRHTQRFIHTLYVKIALALTAYNILDWIVCESVASLHDFYANNNFQSLKGYAIFKPSSIIFLLKGYRVAPAK